MKFDLFDLSVKDLTTKNVIVRSNSTGPLYIMHLLGSFTPSSTAVAALAAVPHTLTVVASTTWHHRLSHPGPEPYLVYLGHLLFSVPVRNMIFVMHVS
jgi:hypothetical protein